MDGGRNGVVGDLSRVPVSEDLNGGGLEVGDTSLRRREEKGEDEVSFDETRGRLKMDL